MLNRKQIQFCQEPSKFVRLLAPAGSGKTLSLLHRCKYLIENDTDKDYGTSNHKTIIFTFTKSAAYELRDRLELPEFQSIKKRVEITTLNKWGNRFISEQGIVKNKQTIERNVCRNYVLNTLQAAWNGTKIEKILTESKKWTNAEIIFGLIDDFKTLGFKHISIKTSFSENIKFLIECGMQDYLLDISSKLNRVGIIKSEFNPITDIAGNKNFITELFNNFIPFWKKACEQPYKSGFITLDDQKYLPLLYLENKLSQGIHKRGTYNYSILVDEFQDINPLDLALIKAIASYYKAGITIVGDDDQAIFEWRGATPTFILNPDEYFQQHFVTHILSTNYRIPSNILSYSQTLIKHNQRRHPKDVTSKNANSAHISFIHADSIPDAVTRVRSLVMELYKTAGRIALIGRKRGQILPYQIIFAGQQIPYYSDTDLIIFLSQAFDNLKRLLRIKSSMSNSITEDLLFLCDNIERRPLCKDEREQLKRYLLAHSPNTMNDAIDILRKYPGCLKKDKTGKMREKFCASLNEFINAANVANALQSISEKFGGFQKDYGKSLDDVFYADPPFLYLIDFATSYADDYNKFLADLEKAVSWARESSSQVNDSEPDDSTDDSWKNKLHLLTANRAKGREYDAVIILDANDGTWPSKYATTEMKQEQERRLFYVAMTRAKKYLFFAINETMKDTPVEPTPYFKEMDLQE